MGEAASTYPPTGVDDGDGAGVGDGGEDDGADERDAAGVADRDGDGVAGRDCAGDRVGGEDGVGFFFFFAMITPARRAIGSVCAA